MSQKHIVLTGSTSGIGQQVARQLAVQQHVLYLIVRNAEKQKNIQTELLMLNPRAHLHFFLADLSSARECFEAAAAIANNAPVIDVLINNAGSIFEERQTGNEELEKTFAINFFSPFILSQVLYKNLKASTDGRIINVVSEMYRMSEWSEDFQMEQTKYSGAKAYANSKLNLIYYTQWLAAKAADNGVKTNAYHPGVVDTEFGQNNKGFFNWGMDLIRPFTPSAEKAAEPLVQMATGQEEGRWNGEYINKGKPGEVAEYATDKEKMNLLIHYAFDLAEKLNLKLPE